MEYHASQSSRSRVQLYTMTRQMVLCIIPDVPSLQLTFQRRVVV